MPIRVIRHGERRVDTVGLHEGLVCVCVYCVDGVCVDGVVVLMMLCTCVCRLSTALAIASFNGPLAALPAAAGSDS